LNPRPKVLLSGFYMFILPIQFSDPKLPEGWRPEIPSPLILPQGQGKVPGASLLNDAVT
jgi:hypothetical protein